jgi:hypothetical protein
MPAMRTVPRSDFAGGTFWLQVRGQNRARNFGKAAVIQVRDQRLQLVENKLFVQFHANDAR